MKIDLKPNELVVKAGDSEFLNGKDVKGKLIATNQRLYFEAIAADDSSYSREIEPSEIREVMPFNTFAFMSNGLNIVTVLRRRVPFSRAGRSEQIAAHSGRYKFAADGRYACSANCASRSSARSSRATDPWRTGQ